MPEQQVALQEHIHLLPQLLADSVEEHSSMPGCLQVQTKEELQTLKMRVEEALEAQLEIEPLFFEDIHVTSGFVGLRSSFSFEDKHSEAWLRNESMPVRLGYRYGVTRLHDNVHMLWDRRHAQDYSRDGNHFPKRVLEIMAKLQSAGMPLALSLTVWTPAQLPGKSPQVNPDPILVLELADGACIALCRWNPTL